MLLLLIYALFMSLAELLKVLYLHSKYPHFNNTYLARMPFSLDLAVCSYGSLDLSKEALYILLHVWGHTVPESNKVISKVNT